ncbi:MAG TPA: spore coat U domain-containing protein [Vicinamibacterales bacterium]|jgi:spore coat protein U-like protein|nr:spore coat U domain-containing protein [Vicinamibacterales bacterium]
MTMSSICARSRWGTVALAALALVFGAARAEAACTASAANDAAFGSVTSFDAGGTSQQTSTIDAGLTCTGAFLAILRVNDFIDATITSTAGGLRGPTGDLIPYTLYADSTTTYPIALGTPFNYHTGTLLDILGLLSGGTHDLPMFIRTTPGANVAAGTYTDTLSVAWHWDYCDGVGVGGFCTDHDVGSGSSTFQVTLVVTNACEITSVSDVDFGQAPTPASFDAVTGSLAVLCTRGLASYTVGLGPGLHPSAGRRQMANGGSVLQYDLFKPATNEVWGAAGAARAQNTAPADGLASQVFDYRAVIYADQPTPPVGIYTDSVVVDVAF